MTSPLFKRAFVRGLNAQLIREGVVFYPSKEAADATADFVADQSNMPDPATQGDLLDIKTASTLVNFLIEGAEHQCKQAGNQYSPVVTKTAQETTPEAVAYSDAIALMEKAAEEHGPNTLQNASPNSAIAASELHERPENYANTGPGIYEPFPSAAQVGIETEPEAPGSQGVPGTNSVVAKSAALQSIVKRIAKTAARKTAGNDIGDQPPNDLRAAAKNSDAAKEELEARPEGYANHDEHQGRTVFDIPAAAQAGDEQNITHKSAFDRLFEATAERILPYLPAKMEDAQKVAHIRHTMGLDTRERAQYLGTIYLKLGAAQESARSVHDHFLKAASEEEEKEEKDEDEDSDPDDKEKGPELPAFLQKKESSTRPRNTLQSISSRLKNLNA